MFFFFFSSRRRHTRSDRDWSSDVCSSDLRLRAVRSGVPAHAAGDGRAEVRVLAERQIATADERARLRIDTLHEVDVLGELPDVHDARVLAIVDEDVPALVGMYHELLAVAVEHHELADRAVEVPGVVGQLLVIELQPPRVRVERDDGGREEIVTRARAARLPVESRPVIERRRVARAPPYRVGLRIEAPGHPAAAATRFPRLAAPRLLRLLGAGDREELPDLAPAGGVDAEDRAAPRPFAALRADDDLVLDEQRRPREADGKLLGVDELGVPRRLAGLHVERDEPPVDSAHEHLALPEGDPTCVWR